MLYCPEKENLKSGWMISRLPLQSLHLLSQLSSSNDKHKIKQECQGTEIKKSLLSLHLLEDLQFLRKTHDFRNEGSPSPLPLISSKMHSNTMAVCWAIKCPPLRTEHVRYQHMLYGQAAALQRITTIQLF